MKVDYAYKPEGKQELIHKSEALYRVVCAGRKFGKSVLARQELIMQAICYQPKKRGGIFQPGNYWIVSPTIKQGRQNHWRQLIEEIPFQLVKRGRGQPLINGTELTIELVNGAIIHIVGAENADKIRGAGVVGMVVDEAAYIPKAVWEMVLEPELLSTKGWVLFISTPKRLNWFHAAAKRGDHDGIITGEAVNPDGSTIQPDKDWMSWRFTSYDSPRQQDPDRKKALERIRDRSSVETFAQEYLADFTKLEGLIFKEFKPQIHVVKPFDIPKDVVGYRAIDWGAKNPTAVLFFAPLKDGRIVLFDEIYETDITTADLADKIRAKSYNRPFGNTYADPSGRQRILDLDMTFKIPTEKATRESSTTKTNWVNLGIDKVKETLLTKLPDGTPKFQVFNTCENFLREIELYSWKEMPTKGSELNHPGVPENANDHAMDAMRYFFVSYQPNTYDDVDLPDDTSLFDEAGFY